MVKKAENTMTVGRVVNVEKVWLNTAEACEYLSIGETVLRRLRQEAKIRFAQFGKLIWYRKDHLDKFIESNLSVKL